jgi:hypothetical protein
MRKQESLTHVCDMVPTVQISPALILHQHARCHVHNSCRRRFGERVAAENLRMYNRLQAVKPSKDTAAAQLRREWETAQKYSRNARKWSPARHGIQTHSHRAATQLHDGTSMPDSAAEPASVLHVTIPSRVN